MAKLTRNQVSELDKPGRYGVDTGLYLNVAKGGSKSWIQRIWVGGRRLDKGLGGFPATSLTQAIKMSESNRVAVADGRDPWAERSKPGITVKAKAKGRTVMTFSEAARTYCAIKAGELTSKKNATNWIQTLERHVFPVIGDVPVNEITRSDVLAALEPIWWTIPDSARRIKYRMVNVLDWCTERDLVAANVAKGITKVSLPPQPKVVEHRPALHFSNVPEAIKKIRDSVAWDATKLAFEFLILTASRSGEVRGATWAEMDLDNNLWTIPADRMKTGHEHRQPLSIQALMILRYAKEKLGGDGLVFPSPNGQPLSDAALSLRARKDNLGCVPHGFRSSFRDWAAECSGASYDAIEMCLAHAVGKAVERAYFRSDLLELRRPILDDWANHCDQLPF